MEEQSKILSENEKIIYIINELKKKSSNQDKSEYDKILYSLAYQHQNEEKQEKNIIVSNNK